MKKLDLSAVSASTGFPVKSGSIQHLQSAYTEAIAESVKSVIGPGYDSTRVYILSGLLNSGTGLTYNITSGSVFFNGEVYLVPAFAGTIVGPDVLVGVITTSYFSAVNADPVQFTDGVPRNVHQIRQIVLQSGLSGSGSANYVDFLKANSAYIPVGGSINYRPPTGDLSEFDNTGLGIAPNVQGWALCTGNHGTLDETGLFEVMYKSGDVDFGALDQQGGAKSVALTGAQNGTHSHLFTIGQNGGAHIAVRVPGNTDSVSVDFGNGSTLNSGNGDPHDNLVPYITKLRIQRIY